MTDVRGHSVSCRRLAVDVAGHRSDMLNKPTWRFEEPANQGLGPPTQGRPPHKTHTGLRADWELYVLCVMMCLSRDGPYPEMVRVCLVAGSDSERMHARRVSALRVVSCRLWTVDLGPRYVLSCCRVGGARIMCLLCLCHVRAIVAVLDEVMK